MLRLLPLLLLAACASRHGVVAASDPVTLPLVHTDVDPDRWYALITLSDGVERAWFVDTGYGRTTCDDDLVEALGVRQHGRVRVKGEGGRVRARRARLPGFALGAHRVGRLRCVVRDLPSTSSIEAPRRGHVAGVLGSDLLRRFHVTLDPSEAGLTLAHPETRLPAEAPGVIRLRREQGWSPRLELRVDLDGRSVPMVLDVGATRTFVDGERLGLVPIATRVIEVAGTGGTEGRQLSMYQVELGLAELRRPAFLVLGRPRSARTRGLLGLDALATVRLELDPRHRRARLVDVGVSRLPVWRP